MKTLVLDLETAPNQAYTWGLFKQTISLGQLKESGSVIGVGVKWHDAPKVWFYSDFHDGHQEMLEKVHALVDEADAIVTYNGVGFDMKWLRREWLLAGFPPPSPWKDIDLLRTVRSQFRFVSAKLANVTSELGLSGKLHHTGFDMWVKCMANDPKAWALMARYCRQDVVTTGELYDRILPWIKGHPHMGLYGDTVEQNVCSTCGSANVQKRGFAYTALGRFQQYQCMSAGCGRWSRGKKLLDSVDLRGTS